MSDPGAGAKKKGTSPLTIVLVLVGVAFLLGVLGLGIAGFLVWRNPEGRKLVGLMGDTYKLIQKAQKAPGTKELRALGCQQAMVMDFDEFVALGSRYDAGPAVPPTVGTFVMCAAKPWGTPPACDDAAKTYLSGAGPREKSFIVSVTQSGKSKAICQALYDKSGARQSDFDQDLGVEPPAE